MSTNYFHYAKPPCPTCGHQGEPRHIGKSSVGWCFQLHVYPDDINGYEDWRERWKTGVIRNEYDEVVTPEQMEKCVTGRSPAMQHAPVDGCHCIANGVGTWDYIVGEFS